VKVLACMPHFFRAGAHAVMGSARDRVEDRARVVGYCIRRLASLLGDNEFLLGTPGSVANAEVRMLPRRISGELRLCVSGDDHLLDSGLTTDIVARPLPVGGDPRMLGFACREVFLAEAEAFDLFCFIEDDTAILDGAFFDKTAAFYERFGHDKVILPSRYELFGARDLAWRCYLERDHPPAYAVEPENPGPPELRMPSYGADIVLERTTSVSAGCYVITRDQLLWWSRRPDFRTPRPGRDIMESAQTPLGGRRPVYRPAAANLNFLEVHHVPDRLCRGATPYTHLRTLSGPEIARREAAPQPQQ
jgi:hypothetical protein